MASALLASRNEPFWGERKVYMRKNPNPNPNPNPHLKPKPNPNLNKQSHTSQIHVRQADESAVSAPSVSDDSSFHNNRRESSSGGYVSFNIASYSRRELKELKKRLISELEQVRILNNRIELREIQSRSGYSASQYSGSYGGREVTSDDTRPPPPPLHLNGNKEKRKRPLPFVSERDPKRPALEPSSSGKLLSSMMKRCGQMLSKLMKHKHGWIFNVPVDVVGMGLHDYNQIIKHPMDLGTVKKKLSTNLYSSPLDFASDVRLTFNNALVYNPKGHDVYAMAEQLLVRFEEMFEPANKKLPPRNLPISEVVVAKKPDPVQIPIAVVPASSNRSSSPAVETTPVSTTSGFPSARKLSTGRTVIGQQQQQQQPKPKAKDPNKREMSFEEKQKLGMSLQNLPQEKMDQVLHIIKKRNANVAQDGDEIELDIEVLDTETLWDLDRFVCNCKKMMSKIKKQAFPSKNTEGSSKSPEADPEALLPTEDVAVGAVSASTSVVAAKKSKKGGETVEEDVDIIGDEMPAINFLPVEIEKDAGGGYASRSSSSSSSSSGSSSSSDSDSGSSSGSDSDGDGAQSPCTESKASPRTKEE